MGIITSVSYEQDEIIQNILFLYNRGKTFDADVTFSKGVFYKKIERPKFCSDISPLFDFVHRFDCRDLPFRDSEINSLMYDPPFLATTGKSLLDNQKNNIINKRFSVFPSEKELFQFYIDSIKEFYRVLQNNGILVVKIQDKVSSGKQYLSHNFIINEAEKIGFYCEDLFVLIAKNRIIANWQRNQKHARKFHSYFLVFRKK